MTRDRQLFKPRKLAVYANQRTLSTGSPKHHAGTCYINVSRRNLSLNLRLVLTFISTHHIGFLQPLPRPQLVAFFQLNKSISTCHRRQTNCPSCACSAGNFMTTNVKLHIETQIILNMLLQFSKTADCMLVRSA